MIMDINFSNRHIGPDNEETIKMLDTIGASDLNALMEQTIPQNIAFKTPLNVTPSMQENEYLNHLQSIAKKNKLFQSYIGQGYNNCLTPSVIKRNVLENPGWYTAYTPYQAEISQGRLEALMNFQTMATDLTGMELSNASLLDEATAAAEAMTMFYNISSKNSKTKGRNTFFVSEECFPQTIEVLKTRSEPIGIKILVGSHQDSLSSDIFGALIQYPSGTGEVYDYKEFVSKSKELNIKVAVAADLLSLTLLTPPGEWGADVVLGSTQRFGVPLGYGGPHAAYFSTKEEYKRYIPGRIIGASSDTNGKTAYRMALQTREQHIRRDKATSNICTSQVLLAVMAGMYGVFHGPNGLKNIAKSIHLKASILKSELEKLGHTVHNNTFFDTLSIIPKDATIDDIKTKAITAKINFNYSNGKVGISIDETTTKAHLADILEVFSKTENISSITEEASSTLPESLVRKSDFLLHPVFNTHHSETEMMRYIKHLENKDLTLTHSMIPLGSCTMKLNAATELYPISWPEFGSIHPYVPQDQALGYKEVIEELEDMLCSITGFSGVSLQPNSGAQGEYAGLMVIREYHRKAGDNHRNIVLIPSSAHGTNPASAVMCGLKVIVVKCDENGNIDIVDLKEKAETHADSLCAFMVTYPSTHGVFEKGIVEINDIVHKNGGLVYMDGANLNAQIGLTNPATIGADVCHLNLHKTFAIPHGGGGPGMGPIGVVEKLKPFLPRHSIIKTGGADGISSISQAPWGSALILIISYGYIKLLGDSGLLKSTQAAILNANYIKDRLKNDYPVLYVGENGRVAHELILDCRDFKKATKVEVEDIAKRLVDYGFHAPTVSFPVAGTLMIEPTESESKQELDRFCEAMLSIKQEIAEIENGVANPDNNVLKNAPHSSDVLVSDNWDYEYTREKAAFPLPWVKSSKFWPPVGRVDNAQGDRNLICSCPPITDFMEETIQSAT